MGSTRTADFDLRTQDGMNAYQSFLRTGNLPTDNGPGVRNVGETLTKNVDKGATFLGYRLNENVSNTTANIAPGGTMRVQNDQRITGLGTMQTDHLAGPNGSHTRTNINGFVEANQYNLGTEAGPRADYQMRITDPNAAKLARTAFTGTPSNDGSPFTVQMTEAQARDMVNRMVSKDFQPAPGPAQLRAARADRRWRAPVRAQALRRNLPEVAVRRHSPVSRRRGAHRDLAVSPSHFPDRPAATGSRCPACTG